jgi:hypothetical protein
MPLVDNAVITIYDPTTRPPTQLGLEIVVLACAGATLAHALRARRRGDASLLYIWLTILVYGIGMEILSYNAIKNFWHAQFTVMFYHHQLPLYVTAVYPVLLYTGIVTARRLGLPRAAEPLVSGLIIVAMDVPFDILGPVAGWWRWSNEDPNLAVRWYGVPVTSYYWHLAFGGCLALLTRLVMPKVFGWRAWWRVLAAAAGTIVLGMIAFGPFHGLKALGVPDGVVVAGALALALATLVVTARRPAGGPDLLLLAIPTLFYAYHVGLALALSSGGRVVVILSVTALAAGINAFAHGRRRASTLPAF